MRSFDFKKIRLDLLIILGFAVVSLLFCYPQLQGKKLVQGDNIHWQCMAHEAMAYHDSTGKDVLWSNSMFGGMPTYTTYVGATVMNFAVYAQNVFSLLGKPAYYFFIAMLCFYLLTQVLGINRWVGAIGALAYAFSSYNAVIISVGHDTKMFTLGYLPAAFAGLFLIFKERRWVGAALLALSIGLIFVNNHFQVIYYMFIMFLCLGITLLYIAIKNKDIKSFVISAVIAIVAISAGVAPSLGSVLTTKEYTQQTMRGGASELSGHDKGKTSGGLDKDYAFQWSCGLNETFCIMIPYLYGGSSSEPAEMAPKTLEAIGGNAEELPLYWGDQPFLSGPVFFGAVICFLFLLGMMVVRSPHKWWMLVASIIGIVLAWGKNMPEINYFLFDHVPMLNKFRTVEMALIIPEFLFPLMAVWGINEILERHKTDAAKLWKDVKIAGGITAGICLVFAIAGSMFLSYTGTTDAQMQPELVKLLREDRSSLASISALKSAIYIIIAAGLLWAFIKEKINRNILIGGIVVICMIDLLPVAHNYLKDKNFVDASDYEAQFAPRPVDQQIMKDPDPYYRVLDLSRNPYNDATQAYFHKCVGGYHPAKMEIYQDLIDRQLSKGFNAQVLNMLNTKYIIAGGQKSAPQVIPNPTACGNAWFVDEIKWTNSADEDMNGLNAANIGDTAARPDGFQPKKTAVVRSSFKDAVGNYAFGKDSTASIKLDKYGLDDISFKSNNSKDGFAVFSDIYYANGWKAFVDGKETPIVKADYVLRAIKIPAGAHSIQFTFHPSSFYTGQKIALAGSILLLIVCLCGFYPLLKMRKETTPVKK